MYKNRKTCSVCAVACALLALGGCLALAKANGSQAGAVILSQTDTELSIRFKRADGWGHTVNFFRDDPEDFWRADVSPYSAGIVFGNDEPRFASTSRLRAQGIGPYDAVRTFDASIVDSSFDDVTIYRTRGHNLVIALWLDHFITEIWYVGHMVQALLDAEYLPGDNTCEKAVERCCKKESVPWDPFDPPDPWYPDEYPWPDVDDCESVLSKEANCTFAQKQQVCDCLIESCNFCDNNPEMCEDLEEWNCEEAEPGEPCGIPMDDKESRSCAAGVVCPPDEDEDGVDGFVHNVLGEILNRVQAIVDIEQL